MTIPIKPIGSILRPLPLIDVDLGIGNGAKMPLDWLQEGANRATDRGTAVTGFPAIQDRQRPKYHGSCKAAFEKVRARAQGSAIAASIKARNKKSDV